MVKTNNSRYKTLLNEISLVAKNSGRDPTEISLIAVTKQVDWQTASNLYEEGQRDFAENRVVDALQKIKEAPLDCHWHFIGNLQSNKIRKIIGKFDLIHSVDSLPLAGKISEVSLEKGLVTSILIQVNTSGEASKQGMSPQEFKEQLGEMQKLKGISIKGLMTMAPFTENEVTIRQCFYELRKLRDEFHLHHLSMGMSHDFKIAIEEGATLLRIGTTLFQPKT